MKKLVSALIVLLLLATLAFAEETGAVTWSFDANPTTGFSWTGFVFAGDSVVLDSAEGTYVSTPVEEITCGSGGQTFYTLTPVAPGTSLVLFTYGRSWEPEWDEQRVLLADVDENLTLYVSDVTEAGVLKGEVIAVNEEDCSVFLMTEQLGEVIARFDEGETLPVAGEMITIYTNGTMTMSLPAIVNVIAWASVPSDLARLEDPAAE